MSKQPVFSIIMPAYNSQQTIGIALESVRMQDFDQSGIEILVIDGGSDDRTLEIARAHGATILENPDRLPEYAKRIGFLHAGGRFAIEMDSDEEFVHADQLSKRTRFLEENADIACMLADRLLPVKGYGICCAYLNAYGDPFSYFVYQGKGSVRRTFARNIDTSRPGILCFDPLDRKPIGDGGTTLFSMQALREIIGSQMNDISFVSAAFERLVSTRGCCGCLEGDDIRHHSGATIKKYLSKLRFRVINNIFQQAESGFSVRQQSNPALTRRKRLFLAYALSILLPLLDSARLAFRHKDATMLLHFFYVYYVCACSAWYYLLKALGVRKANSSYAK